METTQPPTAPPHWRTVLQEQGRVDRNKTLAWLAEKTGVRARTVYAYSQGSRTPSSTWLAEASRVLGCEVAAS